MPEGDTIHHAAKRIGSALVGKQIMSIETPQRRHERDRWPERLSGRGVRAVDAHGKHLFLRFDGELTLHSPLRMSGGWGVYEHARRWGRSRRGAWAGTGGAPRWGGRGRGGRPAYLPGGGGLGGAGHLRVRARRPAVPPLGRRGGAARPGGEQPPHLLVPRMPELKRVGHKGADLIAP